MIRAVDAVLPGGRAVVDLWDLGRGRVRRDRAGGNDHRRHYVDAAGTIALPGGIDLHVHIQTFFGGTTTKDDFFDGTAAALFGGTTTIAQFAIPRPGETSANAVTRTHAEADGRAVTDYAIHGCVVRDTYAASVAQFAELRSAGIGTVKLFSAYTDVIGLDLDQISDLLVAAARTGLTVFVHAETDALIREGIDAAVRQSQLGPLGHAASRPADAEDDAIRTIWSTRGQEPVRRSTSSMYRQRRASPPLQTDGTAVNASWPRHARTTCSSMRPSTVAQVGNVGSARHLSARQSIRTPSGQDSATASSTSYPVITTALTAARRHRARTIFEPARTDYPGSRAVFRCSSAQRSMGAWNGLGWHKCRPRHPPGYWADGPRKARSWWGQTQTSSWSTPLGRPTSAPRT